MSVGEEVGREANADSRRAEVTSPALRPAGRWDWWELPREWLPAVGAEPGIVYRSNGVIEIHRSHLPLLRSAGHPVPADAEASLIDGRYGVTYRPWQRRAAAWMQSRRGVLLAAEPRLGKSAISLTMHNPRDGQLFILAPLDVRAVWLEWIERVFPGASVTQLEGHQVDLDAIKRADVVIGHYDILAWQRVSSMAPATLIIDEVHLLSNASSQRATAVRFFAGMAQRIISLSGTPLWNHTRGLWPVLAVTNPGAWGPKPFEFQQRHCTPTMTEYGWRYGEISHAGEWHARLSEIVFTATWRDERPDLLPTVRERVIVPCDSSTIGAVEMAAEEFRVGGTSFDDDSVIGAISRYRKQTGLLKVPTAVDRALAISRPVVTWSWHKEVAKAIAKGVTKAGRSAFMIHGDMPAAKRLAAIAAWRDTKDGVLSATLAVGQVGLDLSHACDAIGVEFHWIPAVLFQADMRTFHPDRVMTSIQITLDHPVELLVTDHVMAKLARGVAAGLAAAGDDFSIAEEANDDGDLLAELARVFTRR